MARKYERNPAYQKFVNEILDDIVMASQKVKDYTLFSNNGLFKIHTVDGTIDFYPTTNKINFSKVNRWQTDGLNRLLAYVGHKSKETELDKCKRSFVYFVDTYLNHGDMSDLGNYIGLEVAKRFAPDMGKSDFIHGIEHGISLTDRSHDKIS